MNSQQIVKNDNQQKIFFENKKWTRKNKNEDKINQWKDKSWCEKKKKY